MEVAKLIKGKSVAYATPSSEGRMVVSSVYKDGNNSTWVLGHDKKKGKDIKVRPAQTSR
jgi:hypothetical protein